MAELEAKRIHIGAKLEPALVDELLALRESRHEPVASVLRRLIVEASRRAKRRGTSGQKAST